MSWSVELVSIASGEIVAVACSSRAQKLFELLEVNDLIAFIKPSEVIEVIEFVEVIDLTQFTEILGVVQDVGPIGSVERKEPVDLSGLVEPGFTHFRT